MQKLAGQQIEEMADVRASRKHKVVLLCSAFTLVIVFTFCLVRFIEQDYLLAVFNLLSSVLLALNVFYLTRHSEPKHSGLVLSLILLAHSVAILFFGQGIDNRLLWLYPITAMLILSNDFKLGAILSLSLYFVVVSSVLFSPTWSNTSELSQDVFLLSLLALNGPVQYLFVSVRKSDDLRTNVVQRGY